MELEQDPKGAKASADETMSSEVSSNGASTETDIGQCDTEPVESAEEPASEDPSAGDAYYYGGGYGGPDESYADTSSLAAAEEPPAVADSALVSDPYPDGYPNADGYDEYSGAVAVTPEPSSSSSVPAISSGNGAPPPPPTSPDDGEEDEEEPMLRMSFLEHLEEFRSRAIKCLAGIGIAFLLSLIFANNLWLIVSEPATAALTQLGVPDPRLAQIKPMEVFSIVWIKLPMLTAIFLSSPWILYQIWAFIAPGLYKRERRWAGPFVICSAGLFISGGLFAYFVAFRYGLTFLLGIGRDIRIQPIVSVSEYFDLFVNVTLGVGIVFELPILIFFLTLLRIVTPQFLVRNSRYAILLIVLAAALITPTPDIFNLMLFSVPMVILYFVGVLASYVLVLNREQQHFPWRIVFYILTAILVMVAGVLYLLSTRYGYHVVPYWPFLTQ